MEKDPYKYFRVEGRELLDGLSQGVLLLEKGPQDPEVVARLLRLAHTLKGAARVVRLPALADLAHAAEGILTAHRDLGRALSREQSAELLRLFDEGGAQLSALDAPAPPDLIDEAPPTPPRAAAAASPETLRVDLRELDTLLHAAAEAGIRAAAARRGAAAGGDLVLLSASLAGQLADLQSGGAELAPAGLARARALASELHAGLSQAGRSLLVDLGRVESGLTGLAEAAQRLRLVPAQSIFAALERAVRDAAEALGKRVTFEATGGAVRLDGSVLPALRDALTQLVRNAVAHGLEDGAGAGRSALGKPPVGSVRLVVERRGGRVAFVCSDDGRGIDLEAVRRAAVARGLVTEAQAGALAPDEVLGLLGGGGVTTSAAVTQLSGRGIGLELVRATVARLHGELVISSAPGQGTALSLLVPMAIASLQCLLVEAGGATAAIPLDAVATTLRLAAADLRRSAERDSLLYDHQMVPFAPLGSLLRSEEKDRAVEMGDRPFSAVVVRTGPARGDGGKGRCAALGVDRLLGCATIVVRPLPALVEADPAVAGVWLDAEGNPQLVLDPEGLVAAAGCTPGASAEPLAVAATRDPILVIDDSLTTRMLEQSILESAGYQVEVASSAEEALGKARARPHCLFVVDVEMPGMNGFEFVALTRKDPALRLLPAILVTSLSGAEDRRRGAEAGASAFIVKGEFDQGHLLDVIRTLIG